MTFLLNEQFDSALSGYADDSGYSTVHTDIRIRTSKKSLKPVRIHQLDKLLMSQMNGSTISDLKYADARAQSESWEIDNGGGVSDIDWQPTGVDPELQLTIGTGASNVTSYIKKNKFSTFKDTAIDISGFSNDAQIYVVFTASGELATSMIRKANQPELDANFFPSWMAFSDKPYGTANPDWRIMFFSLSQLGNNIGQNGEKRKFECTFPKSVLNGLESVEMVKFRLYNPDAQKNSLTISKIGIREPNQEPQPMDVNTRDEILTRSTGFSTNFLEDPSSSQVYKIWSDDNKDAIPVISGTLVADFNAGYLIQNAGSAIEMSGKSRIDFDSDPISLSGSNFTFECWFKLTEDSVNSERPMGLISKYSETNYDNDNQYYNNVHGAYRIGIHRDEIVLQVGINDLTYSSGAKLIAGDWHHIAITRKASVLRMYANGKCVFDEPTPSPTITDDTTSSFALGTWS